MQRQEGGDWGGMWRGGKEGWGGRAECEVGDVRRHPRCSELGPVNSELANSDDSLGLGLPRKILNFSPCLLHHPNLLVLSLIYAGSQIRVTH